MEIQPIGFVMSAISLIFVLFTVRKEINNRSPRPATGQEINSRSPRPATGARPRPQGPRRMVGPTTVVEGYDNGVVCLSSFDTAAATYATIKLWNPRLNQLRQLPPPPGAAFDSRRRNAGFRLGVGRDPSTGDLKVVRLCSPTRHNLFDDVDHVHLFLEGTEVSVYSLRENSWRVIEWAPLMDPASPECTVEWTCCNHRRSVVVNHCVHWSARFKLSLPRWTSKSGIVAFDLATEAFRVINFPRSVIQISVKDSLAKLFGHLALVIRARDSVDIWVMKRYGDSNSWTKRVSLNLITVLNLPGLIRPVHVSKIELKNDGFIVIFTNRGTVFYDIKTKTVQRFCERTKGDTVYVFDRVVPSKSTSLFPRNNG